LLTERALLLLLIEVLQVFVMSRQANIPSFFDQIIILLQRPRRSVRKLVMAVFIVILTKPITIGNKTSNVHEVEEVMAGINYYIRQ
jgi:hypothetical protein